MDALSGLTDFFYNLVPGTLFLLALNIIEVIPNQVLPDDPPTKIFWILILGFFLGFFGQAIAKVFKHRIGFNETIMESIINKKNTNNEKLYTQCLIKLKGLSDNVIFDKKHLVNNLRAMDNFLRNDGSPYVINHFAQRSAFWANIFLGSAVILLIIMIQNYFYCELVNYFYCLSFKLLTLFSFCFMADCSRTEYESVLQTFALTKNNRK